MIDELMAMIEDHFGVAIINPKLEEDVAEFLIKLREDAYAEGYDVGWDDATLEHQGD